MRLLSVLLHGSLNQSGHCYLSNTLRVQPVPQGVFSWVYNRMNKTVISLFGTRSRGSPMNGLRLSERYAFAFGMMGLVAVGCISVGSAVTAAETVQIQVLKNNTILFSKSVQLQGMNSIVIDDTRDASLARTRQTNTEVRVGNTIIVSPKSVADQQLSCVIDIKNISVDPGWLGTLSRPGLLSTTRTLGWTL